MGQHIRDRALRVLNQHQSIKDTNYIRIDLEGVRCQSTVSTIRNLFSANKRHQENCHLEIEGMENWSGDWGFNKALMGIDDVAQEIIEGRFAIKGSYWDRADVPLDNQYKIINICNLD